MDNERIIRAVRNFYRSEWHSGLFLLIWGFISLLSGVLLLVYSQNELWQGFAVGAIVLAVIQLIVASVVLRRKFIRFRNFSQTLNGSWIMEEKELLQQVLYNHKKSRIIESLLFFLGFLLMMIGAFGDGGYHMTGSGMAISLQSGVTLVFYLFADLRATLYNHEISR